MSADRKLMVTVERYTALRSGWHDGVWLARSFLAFAQALQEAGGVAALPPATLEAYGECLKDADLLATTILREAPAARDEVPT